MCEVRVTDLAVEQALVTFLREIVMISPSEVVARWTLELDALAAEGGLFVLTNHPFLSGRPSRAAALERLIEHAQGIDGLWISTCAEIADWVAGLDLVPIVHDRPDVPQAPPGR